LKCTNAIGDSSRIEQRDHGPTTQTIEGLRKAGELTSRLGCQHRASHHRDEPDSKRRRSRFGGSKVPQQLVHGVAAFAFNGPPGRIFDRQSHLLSQRLLVAAGHREESLTSLEV